MSRTLGTLLAVAALLALGVTVRFLFPFLMGGTTSATENPNWWWIDGLLVLQFGCFHSLLLFPPVRDVIERRLPRELYGCFFTLIACLNLLLLIFAWQASPLVIWELSGAAKWAMNAAYVLSWVTLVYSLYLSGIGWQLGTTPFWAWLRGRLAPPREFEVRGAYRLLRHPVYLSFLGQVWFTTPLTLDRALLVGLMSGYILLGSYFKDRRLVWYLGDEYRRYQADVPGYPLAIGPLGRVPLAAAPIDHEPVAVNP